MSALTDPATGKRLITGYVPTLALSLISAGLFGLLAVISLIRWFRQGKPRWLWPYIISLLMMTLGFLIRLPLSSDPSSLGAYIGQNMFIILSPCLLIAQYYMIVPRLATWLEAEDCLFLSSSKVVKTFVISDCFTFWMQSAGGGMSAAKDGIMPKIGKWLALGGLILQAITFTAFTILVIVFGRRLRARTPEKWTGYIEPKTGGSSRHSPFLQKDWRIMFSTILIGCALILVRCIFRIAEYSQGYDGYLRTTEWAIYVFDTIPIFLASVPWVIIWAPTVLDAAKRCSGVQSVGLHDITGSEDGGKANYQYYQVR